MRLAIRVTMAHLLQQRFLPVQLWIAVPRSQYLMRASIFSKIHRAARTAGRMGMMNVLFIVAVIWLVLHTAHNVVPCIAAVKLGYLEVLARSDECHRSLSLRLSLGLRRFRANRVLLVIKLAEAGSLQSDFDLRRKLRRRDDQRHSGSYRRR